MAMKNRKDENKPLSMFNLVGSERYMVLKVDPHDDYAPDGLITLISPGVLTIKGETLKEVYDELEKELSNFTRYSPYTVTYTEHNNMIEKLKVHIEKYGKDATAVDIVNYE